MIAKLFKTCLLLCLLLGFTPVFSQQGVQNYLTAKGNKLVDKRGQNVLFAGVNWFGFETSLMSPHGIWARDMKSVLKQIKDLGFNSIRIPYCSQMLNPGSTVNISSFGTDPYSGVSPMNVEEATKKTPLEILDILVNWCQVNNLKIILDNHSKKTDGYLNEGLWYTDGYDEARWISDWVFLANRYKGKSAVIACDLKNEPHQSSWGNSSPTTDFNKAAERCGNAILKANPEMLIIVEGVAKYLGDSYWWGGQLKGAKDFPVVLSDNSKLVYSPHEYGPEVFAQTWFSDPAFPANMNSIWLDHFDYLYQNNTAPLFVGEFGIRDQTSASGKALTWFKTFMKFIGGRYSWTFWTLNPNSGDTGGILGDNWTSVNQWKMDELKPFLQPVIPNVVNGTVGNLPPKASFNADKITAVTPAAIKFDASGSSDPEGSTLSYSWNFGDARTDTGKIVNHTYTSAGNFRALLTVRDAQNAPDTFSILIKVTGITVPLDSLTITASAGAGGTISPVGALKVASGGSRIFTITPAAGFSINQVLVNGVSVGAVASFTFANVTTNQTIQASFNVISTGGGACLLTRFGVPRATPLPTLTNAAFTKVYTVGAGAPNLSNVSSAVINWDLASKGLWQLSFNTNNGVPAWWIDMHTSVQTFGQAQPAITFAATGIANLDGNRYYVNVVDANNVVFVEVSGKHALYFSTSTTAPAGCAAAAIARTSVVSEASAPVMRVYPNPASGVKLNIEVPDNFANKMIQVQIATVRGAVVKSYPVKMVGNRLEINIANLVSGKYLINVIIKGQATSSSFIDIVR